MPDDRRPWDAIVVGSGLGGLAAGAAFARKGKRVLVLERLSNFGGAATIYRHGLYGAFFVKGGAHHFVAPLFVDSFVRPAPRAFFRPDRILAVAVARSEGQGRRFFSAAEGLSLTNASTAANCP
jgi:phytoene dehydrogenase-like protein